MTIDDQYSPKIIIRNADTTVSGKADDAGCIYT